MKTENLEEEKYEEKDVDKKKNQTNTSSRCLDKTKASNKDTEEKTEINSSQNQLINTSSKKDISKRKNHRRGQSHRNPQSTKKKTEKTKTVNKNKENFPLKTSNNEKPNSNKSSINRKIYSINFLIEVQNKREYNNILINEANYLHDSFQDALKGKNKSGIQLNELENILYKTQSKIVGNSKYEKPTFKDLSIIITNQGDNNYNIIKKKKSFAESAISLKKKNNTENLEKKQKKKLVIKPEFSLKLNEIPEEKEEINKKKRDSDILKKKSAFPIAQKLNLNEKSCYNLFEGKNKINESKLYDIKININSKQNEIEQNKNENKNEITSSNKPKLKIKLSENIAIVHTKDQRIKISGKKNGSYKISYSLPKKLENWKRMYTECSDCKFENGNFNLLKYSRRLGRFNIPNTYCINDQ